MVVLVVDVVLVEVVETLHELRQDPGLPSFETLNVVALLGFGVTNEVPPQ